MKKILILTSRFPFPVVGGDRLRIYQLCKKLSEKYELSLLSLCESEDELSLDVSNDTVFSDINRVMMPKWRSYLNCVLAIPTQVPLQIAYYRNSEFSKKLKIKSSQHDLIFAHLIRTGDYLIDIQGPKILEMTDAISLNYKRVSDIAKSKGLKNYIYSFEQKRVERYERKIVKQFDANFLVSQIDKDHLFPSECKDSNKVSVVSNGVDTGELTYDFSSDSMTLVFIGNLYSVQNLDAALWFAREIMPALNPAYGLSFKIIGRIKDVDKEKFAGFPNVIATGEVDSVQEEAKGAFAGICSVRLGAGIQNKVLEYLALGIPCITTPTGLEGFSAVPEKDILVASNVAEFTQQIHRLVRERNTRESLAKAGRRYVVECHSWDTKLNPMLSIVDKVIKQSK